MCAYVNTHMYVGLRACGSGDFTSLGKYTRNPNDHSFAGRGIIDPRLRRRVQGLEDSGLGVWG